MSIGNTQAIRDWINANYYNKQEIIDRFAVEYNCNIRGGSNETITITNPTLETVQTVTTKANGQTSDYANQSVKIKALPGDTISLKGGSSNQTFTYTFGLSSDFDNNFIYCMPPRTILWYGNVMYTSAATGTLIRVSGDNASPNNITISNNNTSQPRTYIGIKNSNVSTDIDYGRYPQVWKTNNPFNFDTTGINQQSNTTIHIKGEHFCPSTNEGYKKNLSIRFGEELNNCTIYLCKDIATDSPDGGSFNISASAFPGTSNNFSGNMTYVAGANYVTTNYSKPLVPSYIYFIFETKALAGNPVNNYIALSEFYFG